MSSEPPISPEAEQDYDLLLDRTISMAEKWLEQQGGFLPCGAAVSAQGEPVGIMVDPGNSPSTQDMMEQLFATLRSRAERGEIRASCACFDGCLTDDDREQSPG